MEKNYVLDTNVLLDDPNCIQILRNGQENNIYIPTNVLLELDGLKNDNTIGWIARQAIDNILKDTRIIILKTSILSPLEKKSPDTYIINEVKSYKDKLPDLILVTNDKIMTKRAKTDGLKTEEFKASKTFTGLENLYTGIVDLHEENQQYVRNCFYWKDGKLHYNHLNGEKELDYDNNLWKVAARNPYQNAMMELLLDDNIDIVSVQSKAGLGKSFISLAGAFYLTFERKRFNKIFIAKSTKEIDDSLGFLPGTVDEKIQPFFMYLDDLILKLHDKRPVNRIFNNPSKITEGYRKDRFEMLPIQYIRGRDIHDAFIFIDECQNLSRHAVRSLLTRFGDNCKVVCCGDIEQIDNPYLDRTNNGLSWIIKKLKGYKNYGHITLKGKKSRGPICDTVLDAEL